MFVVDDVHAADVATIELLHHLARAAQFHRILLLVAFREPPSESLSGLCAVLLDRRAATELELSPLTAEESADLLAQLLDGTFRK